MSLHMCSIFWMLNGEAHCSDISKEKLRIPSTKHLNHKQIKEASVTWRKKLAPVTESYLKNKRTTKESIGTIDRGFVDFGCHDHRLYNNLLDLFILNLHTQYTVLGFLWTLFKILKPVSVPKGWQEKHQKDFSIFKVISFKEML